MGLVGGWQFLIWVWWQCVTQFHVWHHKPWYMHVTCYLKALLCASSPQLPNTYWMVVPFHQ